MFSSSTSVGGYSPRLPEGTLFTGRADVLPLCGSKWCNTSIAMSCCTFFFKKHRKNFSCKSRLSVWSGNVLLPTRHFRLGKTIVDTTQAPGPRWHTKMKQFFLLLLQPTFCIFVVLCCSTIVSVTQVWPFSRQLPRVATGFLLKNRRNC